MKSVEYPCYNMAMNEVVAPTASLGNVTKQFGNVFARKGMLLACDRVQLARAPILTVSALALRTVLLKYRVTFV